MEYYYVLVLFKHSRHIQHTYHAMIPPVAGDRIVIKGIEYEVLKRRLFSGDGESGMIRSLSGSVRDIELFVTEATTKFDNFV